MGLRLTQAKALTGQSARLLTILHFRMCWAVKGWPPCQSGAGLNDWRISRGGGRA